MTRSPALRRDPVFVGARTGAILAGVLLGVGVIAGVSGVGWAVNGAINARFLTQVPVVLDEPLGGFRGATGGGVAVTVPGVQLPSGVSVEAASDQARLVVERPADGSPTGVDRTTGFLARGDAAVVGLAVLAGAVLLAPVLRSVAAGMPFRRGNARRIGVVGLLVLVAGVVGPVLPQVAALRVLDALDLVGPGSPFTAGLGFSLVPAGVAVLVLVTAEAFRRCAELAEDARGLV